MKNLNLAFFMFCCFTLSNAHALIQTPSEQMMKDVLKSVDVFLTKTKELTLNERLRGNESGDGDSEYVDEMRRLELEAFQYNLEVLKKYLELAGLQKSTPRSKAESERIAGFLKRAFERLGAVPSFQIPQPLRGNETGDGNRDNHFWDRFYKRLDYPNFLPPQRGSNNARLEEKSNAETYNL